MQQGSFILPNDRHDNDDDPMQQSQISSAPPISDWSSGQHDLNMDQSSLRLGLSMTLSESLNTVPIRQTPIHVATPSSTSVKYNIIHASVETQNDISEIRSKVDKERVFVGRVDVSGSHGQNATNGRAGRAGRHGRNGQSKDRSTVGERGENGENGSAGEDAFNAQNGFSADNLNILMDRSSHPKELVIKYSRDSHRGAYSQSNRYGYNSSVIDEYQFTSCSRFPLHSNNEYVLFKACGGNGGNGGNGGHGGPGGNGGNGGNGIQEGGNGGDGGHGGDGGRPSYGGNGGNGGIIFVNTYDPRLLVLVKTETQGGRAGYNGVPGEPGEGGKGGKGGHGNVKSGAQGRAGNPGSKATQNVSFDPQFGNDGFTIYRVLDFRTNQIMYEGQKCYSARLLSFDVVAVDDDGIYEPGEEIFLTAFKVHNDGDIPLPAGAILHISPDSNGFILSDDQYILPEIGPKQTVTLTHAKLSAKIAPDLALKTHELSKVISVKAQIDLFDRVFTDSILGCNINVQYPLSITDISYLKQMGRGDSSDLVLSISNLSKNFYPFVYRVTTKDQLFFVETELRHIINQGNVNAEGFTFHTHPIIVGYCTEFYQNQAFEVELIYKDKVIQKIEKYVQAVPHFNPSMIDTTDLLLITNNNFRREDFKAFSDIFQLLNLRANYWDYDFYKGISFQEDVGQRHVVSCVDKYRGKPIIFCAKDKNDIRKFYAMDIAHHFGVYGPILENLYEHKSSVLFLAPSLPSKDDMKNYFSDPSVATKVAFDESTFSGYYKLLYPKATDADNRCVELENEKEKDSIHRFKFKIDLLDIKQVKSDSWVSWKYSYGLSFDRKSDYLDFGQVADPVTGERLENPKLIDILRNKNSSIDFKLLFAVIYSLNLQSKFRVIKELGKTETEQLIAELIRWVIFESVKRELRQSDTFPTLEGIANVLQEDSSLICEATVYSVMNLLNRATGFTYWRSWLPFATLSYGFKTKRTKIQNLYDAVDGEIRRWALECIQRKEIEYFDVDTTILNAQRDVQTSSSHATFPKLRDIPITYLLE